MKIFGVEVLSEKSFPLGEIGVEALTSTPI